MLDEESSLDLLRMSLKSSSVLDDRENSQRLLRLLNFHPLAITKASDYINGNEGTTILDYISILRGSQELVLQLTETRRIVLGEDHPDTLGSMTHLSSIYRSQGELDLAEALDLQVMERREKINGNMHPDTLESMENLALTYRHQGRCKEAEDLDNQVLERRNALGEGHMERVPLSRSQSLSHQEQTKEIDMHEGDAVVLLKDKFLDSVTNNNSSSITQSAKDGGRNTRAELLEPQTIDMRTAFLGNENPETLNSMSDLAARYRSQGRWREAEELLLQVTEKRTKVLSLEHPDTLSSMYSLALTFWSQGLLEKAEELILRVVEARKRVLGKGHPDTLATINSLALTYWSRGLWEMAEEMVIQVLETMKEVLKAEHPQTMRSMANLAQIRWCLGKKREAIDQMAECLRLRRQILGIEHPASRAARRSLITWQRSLPTAISSSARYLPLSTFFFLDAVLKSLNLAEISKLLILFQQTWMEAQLRAIFSTVIL
jgi:tetratricopeptide (TPR) repeat protein